MSYLSQLLRHASSADTSFDDEVVAVSAPRLRSTFPRLSVLLLALSLLSIPAAAQDGEPDNIKDAKEQREDSRREQAEAAERVELEAAELADVQQALDDITEAAEFQQAKVDAAQAELRARATELSRSRDELASTDDRIAELREQVRSVAVAAYVGNPNAAQSLLESESLTDAVRRTSFLGYVNGDQANVFEELRQLTEDQEFALAAAEVAQAESEALEASLAAELIVLQDRLALQAEIRANLATRVANARAELRELEREEAALSDFIKKEQERLTALNFTPSSRGFIKPTAGNIGSGFGPRAHPILAITRLHAGLDIGGASGQPIVAANDGRVIWAGWRGGYGNAVIIDHGNGRTTLYAHMSSIGVSQGADVDRGDTIGAVGTTGLSTGPHLHFELRLNGAPVDPRPYLP